jgi:hypothetical protein
MEVYNQILFFSIYLLSTICLGYGIVYLNFLFFKRGNRIITIVMNKILVFTIFALLVITVSVSMCNMINEVVIFNLYNILGSIIYFLLIANISIVNRNVFISTFFYLLLSIVFSGISIYKINSYPQTILYSYNHLVCFGYQAGISANIVLLIYKIYLQKNDNNIFHIMMLEDVKEPPKDTCSICLERFYDEEKNEVSQCVIKTRCHHYFHRDCLKMLQSKLNCPLCRKDMKILHFV